MVSKMHKKLEGKEEIICLDNLNIQSSLSEKKFLKIENFYKFFSFIRMSKKCFKIKNLAQIYADNSVKIQSLRLMRLLK